MSRENKVHFQTHNKTNVALNQERGQTEKCGNGKMTRKRCDDCLWNVFWTANNLLTEGQFFLQFSFTLTSLGRSFH